MFSIIRFTLSTIQGVISAIYLILGKNLLEKTQDPSASSLTMKNIVILGGSYSGISTAHRILKQAPKNVPFKITLVSPNSHFYWNMASARGIVPGQLTDEQLFRPIADGFSKYPAAKFEFIIGSAKSLDVDNKKVLVSNQNEDTSLDYDFIILATGTRTKEPSPFKGLGSTEETKEALHKLQAQVGKATKIIIAGAGPTGLETAGEIAFEYGRRKEIVLVTSRPSVLLESTPASVLKLVMQYIQNLNIDLRLNTKVLSTTELPNNQQEVALSDGSKLIADIYIPTFGLVPNSSYVPKKFVNANGAVVVDQYLRVEGAGSVWAIGDVNDAEGSQFLVGDRQSAYAAKSIALILEDKKPLPYKKGSNMMGVQIGKEMATGHFGSVRIPSFVIVWARKNLFLDRMGSMLDGSSF